VAETELQVPCLWNEHYAKIKEYHARHGHIDLPTRCHENKEFDRLCCWLARQKQKYQKYCQGTITTKKPYRIAALENLGINWTIRDDKWDTNYKKLLEYKELNDGSTLVPTKSYHDKNFGNWILVQRNEYKMMKEGKKHQMTPDRLELLNKAGFVWNVFDAKWKEMYEQLLSFRREHGHSDVPEKFSQNPALTKWVQRQRMEHKMLVNGEGNSKKCRLNEERRRKMAIFKNSSLPKPLNYSTPSNPFRLYRIGLLIFVHSLFCTSAFTFQKTTIALKSARKHLPPQPPATTTVVGNQYPPPSPKRYNVPIPSSSSSSSFLDGKGGENDDDEIDCLRRENEHIRREALKRIESLLARLPPPTSSSTSPPPTTRRTAARPETTMADFWKQKRGSEMTMSSAHHERVQQEVVAVARRKVSYPEEIISDAMERKDDLDLLDDTRWKISLNIGREPGTWMPKTWGASGERLLLNLEVCFSPEHLYEDFLGNGVGVVASPKICRVVDGEVLALAAPSGDDDGGGGQTFRVKDGGWSVLLEEGPMNRDLLRFYVEIEKDVSCGGVGGDVYCPAGRIYCTCEYLPLHRTTVSQKWELKKKLGVLERKLNGLQAKMKDEGQFSVAKLFGSETPDVTNELLKIRKEAQTIKNKLTHASDTEPAEDLLQFSKKGDVALTNGGSVCRKIKKSSIKTEYHILGKFDLLAVDS